MFPIAEDNFIINMRFRDIKRVTYKLKCPLIILMGILGKIIIKIILV
jgi:hypothetical protein